MTKENNEKLPLVTIGVLSYNNARFVIETLDSIKAQTYPNIELIIIDDCSRDNSVELILQWLEQNHNPTEFIVNEKNLGIPKNCNKILYKAKGKYLCLFGSDDVMLPERIEIQVGQFEGLDQNIALIYSDGLIINENNEHVFESFWELMRQNKPRGSRFVSYDEILESNIIFAPTSFYRRSSIIIIGGYDEGLSFEDFDINLRLARVFKIIFFPEILVKYRKHPSGLANHLGTRNKDFFLIYRKHLASQSKLAKWKYLDYSKRLLKEDKKFIMKNWVVIGFFSLWTKLFLFLRLPERIVEFTMRRL